jgi:anti-sigma B factor antagonist
VFSLDVAAGDDGRTTITVGGELDLATAPQFGDAVGEALAAGPVLVDLRGVSFMDSAGVRALNTALREASDRGSELRVYPEFQPIVVQVLEMTAMLSLLPLENVA